MYDMPALVDEVRKITGWDKVRPSAPSLPFIQQIFRETLTFFPWVDADRLHRPLARQRHRVRLPLARHPTRPRPKALVLCRARSGCVCGSVDARVPVHCAGEDGVEYLEEAFWCVLHYLILSLSPLLTPFHPCSPVC